MKIEYGWYLGQPAPLEHPVGTILAAPPLKKKKKRKRGIYHKGERVFYLLGAGDRILILGGGLVEIIPPSLHRVETTLAGLIQGWGVAPPAPTT